ncbi:MAG: TetR/AcrR family transcriptional regulator [Eubacteriales bacterium]|nr:TetR/AcrR family transcriptional regulator [Eubacteriales bacterium]
MPKQRITKDMVVSAAFDLARAGGMEVVNVKAIAAALGCSVQPIYSYCDSMEGLRREVEARTRDFIRRFTADRVDRGDLLRSTGRAYAALAREEPNLYKIFMLQQRRGISSLADLYAAEADPRVAGAVARELGISPDRARQLHLHMLIYNIGIGAIFAVTDPGIPAQELFAQQEQAYSAFLKNALEGNEHEI